MKIGLGIDTHKLIPGKYLLLAGVKIKCDKSIEAYSDGDIVYHAVADAIYGCLGLGDIGEQFPDTNPKNSNIDSSIIIKDAFSRLSDNNFKINNIDITILLQTPKISVYKNNMKANIASLVDCEISDINIKGSTNEGLGFIGEERGISCYAIVSLK